MTFHKSRLYAYFYYCYVWKLKECLKREQSFFYRVEPLFKVLLNHRQLTTHFCCLNVDSLYSTHNGAFIFAKNQTKCFYIVSVTHRRKFDIVYVIFVLGSVSCANGARAVKHDIRMYNTCLREFFDINNTSTNIRDANKTFIMKCTQISE